MADTRAGFIVFQPGPPGTASRVNISSTAETVLAYVKDPAGKTLPAREAAVAWCSKWVSLLVKPNGYHPALVGDYVGEPPAIDIISSHRRRYEVRGVILDGRLHGAVSRYPSYLFILQRPNSSQNQLYRIAREKRLSPREMELAKVLFTDLSNKEIGQKMGLSPNTVKGYLKSLALKLGVSSRVGILAAIHNSDEGLLGKALKEKKKNN